MHLQIQLGAWLRQILGTLQQKISPRVGKYKNFKLGKADDKCIIMSPELRKIPRNVVMQEVVLARRHLVVGRVLAVELDNLTGPFKWHTEINEKD